MINCSRWKELTESLKFHANVAHIARAPSEFRFLNEYAPISLGLNSTSDEHFLRVLQIFETSPCGGTPICYHMQAVAIAVKGFESQLLANGQRAVVMICTDGEASDGDIADALRPLKSLPVLIILKLCTDDDRIVEYWNNVDRELELDMDVLEDFTVEAKEVHAQNPWLTYGEHLHLLRSFGAKTKELDLLDEVTLSVDDMLF